MAFGTLLAAIADAYTLTPPAIVAPEWQRALVPARPMLVALAREYSQVRMRELGRRLRRDPSMISRLAASYAANRKARTEAQVRRAIQVHVSQQVNTHA